MATKKSNPKKNIDKPVLIEEKVMIKQFVKARKLPVFISEILGNYINKNEGEGFPKIVKRTISEWDATYLKMNNEKA